MPLRFYDIFASAAKIIRENNPFPLVIIGGINEHLACELEEAVTMGLAFPLAKTGALTPKEKKLLQNTNFDPSLIEIIRAKTVSAEVRLAVQMAVDKKALLIRGVGLREEIIDILLKPETGFLEKGKTASHIGFFEAEKFQRIILITDGAVNYTLDLDIKQALVKNAIDAARQIGIPQPKAALLSAVEAVYIKSSTATDDAIISKMGDRGIFGDAFVDGPLSLDVALLPNVAREKKVQGAVAGNADILVGEPIEVSNGLYKALAIYGQCKSAGVIYGGKIPVVFTSRMEGAESLLNSIAVAVLLA